MQETFKIINEFPDYEISNCGRIRTLSRKVRYTHAVTNKEHYRQTVTRYLKIYLNAQGYKFVQLYKDKKVYNRTIHRLVAITFLEKTDDVVNHKDGNKHNNTVDNLEWCSDSYNHEHATKTGLIASGERVASSRLTDNSVHAIKWFLNKGISHSELAKAFKVSRTTITLINTGKAWSHIRPLW